MISEEQIDKASKVFYDVLEMRGFLKEIPLNEKERRAWRAALETVLSHVEESK